MDKDWIAVFEALKGVYTEGAYSNMSVNEAVSRHRGCRESFVRTFAKGTIRETIRTDYIIDRLAAKGIRSIKERPLIILRMGIYAIDRLDSVPDHAAVNEAVSLAKSVAKGSDRFINGMLRGYLRRRCEFDAANMPEHIRASFSEAVFSLIKDQYPDEAPDIIEALNTPPELYLRVNTLKTDRDSLIRELRESGSEAEASAECSEAVRVRGSGIVSGRLYREGYFSVQSLSSMMAVKALDPEPGNEVLDMCAAPGGKTGYMAELMGNEGHIIACDMHDHRLDLISAALERTGVTIADVKNCDATVPEEDFCERFDTVLADVPCSGLGVTGSKPEIKLTTDPGTYPGLTDIQKSILDNAFTYVKPGGRLMYSTCTLNKNENEDVIKHLLSKNGSSAQIIEMNTFLPYNGKVGFFYCIIGKNAN